MTSGDKLRRATKKSVFVGLKRQRQEMTHFRKEEQLQHNAQFLPEGAVEALDDRRLKFHVMTVTNNVKLVICIGDIFPRGEGWKELCCARESPGDQILQV